MSCHEPGCGRAAQHTCRVCHVAQTCGRDHGVNRMHTDEMCAALRDVRAHIGAHHTRTMAAALRAYAAAGGDKGKDEEMAPPNPFPGYDERDYHPDIWNAAQKYNLHPDDTSIQHFGDASDDGSFGDLAANAREAAEQAEQRRREDEERERLDRRNKRIAQNTAIAKIRKANDESPLYKLPLEVILYIAKFLTPSERARLGFSGSHLASMMRDDVAFNRKSDVRDMFRLNDDDKILDEIVKSDTPLSNPLRRVPAYDPQARQMLEAYRFANNDALDALVAATSSVDGPPSRMMLNAYLSVAEMADAVDYATAANVPVMGVWKMLLRDAILAELEDLVILMRENADATFEANRSNTFRSDARQDIIVRNITSKTYLHPRDMTDIAKAIGAVSYGDVYYQTGYQVRAFVPGGTRVPRRTIPRAATWLINTVPTPESERVALPLVDADVDQHGNGETFVPSLFRNTLEYRNDVGATGQTGLVVDVYVNGLLAVPMSLCIATHLKRLEITADRARVEFPHAFWTYTLPRLEHLHVGGAIVDMGDHIKAATSAPKMQNVVIQAASYYDILGGVYHLLTLFDARCKVSLGQTPAPAACKIAWGGNGVADLANNKGFKTLLAGLAAERTLVQNKLPNVPPPPRNMKLASAIAENSHRHYYDILRNTREYDKFRPDLAKMFAEFEGGSEYYDSM